MCNVFSLILEKKMLVVNGMQPMNLLLNEISRYPEEIRLVSLLSLKSCIRNTLVLKSFWLLNHCTKAAPTHFQMLICKSNVLY